MPAVIPLNHLADKQRNVWRMRYRKRWRINSAFIRLYPRRPRLFNPSFRCGVGVKILSADKDWNESSVRRSGGQWTSGRGFRARTQGQTNVVQVMIGAKSGAKRCIG